MLARLGQSAAAAYAELEVKELRQRVTMLEGELQRAAPAPRKRKS